MAQHINPQRCGAYGHNGRVAGEQAQEHLGRDLHRRHHQGGGAHGHRQHDLEGLADAFQLLRAEVIADEGLCALAEALNRQVGDLGHREQDAHDGHSTVAAVGGGAGVEGQLNQAFGGGHQEGRDTQRQHQHQNGLVGDEVFLADAQDAALAQEEAEHPDHAQGLAQDGGHRSAHHAHVEPVDKDGVQDDVADGADAGGGHAGLGKALVGDKGGHAQGELDKDGAQQVNPQIGHGVGQGVFAGAESQQHRLTVDGEHHAQHHRQHHQNGDAVAQDLLGGLVVAAAHGHRGPGRAAHAHQVGEGGDQDDDGIGHAQAGQRQAAGAGDVAHVNPVHDVVQHVDQLGQGRGQGQAENQGQQGRCAQALVGGPNGRGLRPFFFHNTYMLLSVQRSMTNSTGQWSEPMISL